MKQTWIILGALITVWVFVFVMPFVSWQQDNSKVKLTEQKIEPVKIAQEQTAIANVTQKKILNKPVEKKINSLNQQQAEANKLAAQEAAAKIAIQKAETDKLAAQHAAELAKQQAEYDKLAAQEVAKLAAQQTAIQQQNVSRLNIEHEESDD